MIELYRKYLAFELLKDDKIEILYHKEFKDYRDVHKGWKNIELMPYADTEKKKLREYIVHSNEITYLKIKSGTLYIYTWENGECRYFIKTDNNTLLESYTQSFWYACFPFMLGMIGDKVYFEDNGFKQEGTLSDFIWLQNTKNFCHFIFDSIAPYSTLSHWMKDWEDYKNDIQMITAGELNNWQKDLLYNMGLNNKGKEIRCIKNSKSSQYRVDNMYIAIQTNQLISHESLRKSFSKDQHYEKVEPQEITDSEIIFITRKDQRRKRLINIDEIEKYIQSKGGIVVDTTKLDVVTKNKYLNHVRYALQRKWMHELGTICAKQM